MSSLKITFIRAARGPSGVSTFWLLVFAVAILDDADEREKTRHKKRERAAKCRRKRKPHDEPRP